MCHSLRRKHHRANFEGGSVQGWGQWVNADWKIGIWSIHEACFGLSPRTPGWTGFQLQMELSSCVLLKRKGRIIIRLPGSWDIHDSDKFFLPFKFKFLSDFSSPVKADGSSSKLLSLSFKVLSFWRFSKALGSTLVILLKLRSNSSKLVRKDTDGVGTLSRWFWVKLKCLRVPSNPRKAFGWIDWIIQLDNCKLTCKFKGFIVLKHH